MCLSLSVPCINAGKEGKLSLFRHGWYRGSGSWVRGCLCCMLAYLFADWLA